MSTSAAIGRGAAAVLVLASVALFARHLGPTGYAWFAVAMGLAAIAFDPLLQGITARVTRAPKDTDAPDRTAMITRVLIATIAALLLIVVRDDADPALAMGAVPVGAAIAALLIGTPGGIGPSTVRGSAPLIAMTVFGAALMHWVDRLVLVNHVSRADLGIYSAAVDVSWQFFVPLASLLYVAFRPRLPSASATAEERAPREMRFAVAMIALLLPALTCFILVRTEMVAAIFGDAYAPQASLLPWVAIAAALSAMRMAVLDTGLYRADRAQAVLRTVGISGVVSATLNALYVPRYGVTAAMTVALISQSLAFFIAWRASRDILAWRIPRVQFERIVFCCAGMAFVVLLLPGEVGFVARVTIAALAYASALWLVNGAGFRDWLRTRVSPMD